MPNLLTDLMFHVKLPIDYGPTFLLCVLQARERERDNPKKNKRVERRDDLRYNIKLNSSQAHILNQPHVQLIGDLSDEEAFTNDAFSTAHLFSMMSPVLSEFNLIYRGGKATDP